MMMNVRLNHIDTKDNSCNKPKQKYIPPFFTNYEINTIFKKSY